MMRLAVFALLTFLCLTANAKKPPPVIIRVHGEGNAVDGSKFSRPVESLGTGKPAYMQVLPLLTHREVWAYYPFKASDGSNGVYFKLDGHGANLLSQYTIEHRMAHVFVFVNNRHVISLIADRPVTDGIFTIPRGLSDAEMALIDAAFPLIGQENVRRVEKKALPVKKRRNDS